MRTAGDIALTRTTLLLLVGLLATSCVTGPSGRTSSFQEVLARDPAEYNNYLIKLTYMGPQSSVLVTLVFGSASPRDKAPFRPYRRVGYDYSNDDLPDFVRFRASASEMERIVAALGRDPVFSDSSDRALPVLSLMIMRDVGGRERVFETLVQYSDAGRLLDDFIIPNLDPGNAHGLDLCRFWSKNVGGR